jgi:hypothetical protein
MGTFSIRFTRPKIEYLLLLLRNSICAKLFGPRLYLAILDEQRKNQAVAIPTILGFLTSSKSARFSADMLDLLMANSDDVLKRDMGIRFAFGNEMLKCNDAMTMGDRLAMCQYCITTFVHT